MKRKFFNDYIELIEYMLTSSKNVAVAFRYKNTVAFFKELLDFGVDIGWVNIPRIENEYSFEEYWTTIINGKLWILPACNIEEEKYRYIEADEYLFDGEVSSRMNQYPEDKCVEIRVGDGDDDYWEDDDCEECDYCTYCEDCDCCEFCDCESYDDTKCIDLKDVILAILDNAKFERNNGDVDITLDIDTIIDELQELFLTLD